MLTEDQLRAKKQVFLKNNVFQGLNNLNDGFDTESIFYFSEPDFEIVLNRVEQLKLEVFGIEPWFKNEYYDVKSYEEFDLTPDNPNWYRKAFDEFKLKNIDLQYSASYGVPEKLIE